jgi:hypothetical protein
LPIKRRTKVWRVDWDSNGVQFLNFLKLLFDEDFGEARDFSLFICTISVGSNQDKFYQYAISNNNISNAQFFSKTESSKYENTRWICIILPRAKSINPGSPIAISDVRSHRQIGMPVFIINKHCSKNLSGFGFWKSKFF